MPRGSRFDVPNILQHVIVRGIEKSPIFITDGDRLDFLCRFSRLLIETGTSCLAWALLSNHFHLLVRPMQKPLSNFMQRLLTGYAVSFNRRHDRAGHLYQNRYKSFVCEDEVYLLQLVRYIHLNPLRAGIVKTIEELDVYPWSGHGAIIGKSQFYWQDCDEVLSLFSNARDKAIAAYRAFVGDGILMGDRPEFLGGGLHRNMKASGIKPDQHDERVLGTGEFVIRLREREGNNLTIKKGATLAFSDLVKVVLDYYDIGENELNSNTKRSIVSNCRAIIVYYAVEHIGMKGASVGEKLGISRPAVSRLTQRGKEVIFREKGLLEKLE